MGLSDRMASRRLPRLGDRVRLVEYGEPVPNPDLAVGSEGSIIAFWPLGVFSTEVRWDNGVVEFHDSHELQYIEEGSN